ncbi:MAG: glycosyltransferase [Candidatus Eisenbacteria bacterium]
MASDRREIRVLVPVAHAALGGSQLALLRLIDACRHEAVRFHGWLFSPGPLEEELDRRAIRWDRYPHSWLWAPWGLARLSALLKRKPCDVIYLHASRTLSLLARDTGVPCLERINLPRARGAGGWCRFRTLDRWLTDRNTRVLAVSTALRDELAQRGVDPDKLIVLPDPVEAERFRRRDLRDAARRQLGIGRDERLVLTAGRLVAEKGHADLVRVAEAFRDTSSRQVTARPRFIIVGDGPLGPALAKQIERRGLGSMMRLLPFRRDVTPLYAAADLYVQCSRYEGLPAVVLEARAAGLGIVATDVGGTREALEGYPGARLTAPGDPGAMVREIQASLRSPSSRIDLPLPERYAPAVVARRFVEILRETISATGPEGP